MLSGSAPGFIARGSRASGRRPRGGAWGGPGGVPFPTGVGSGEGKILGLLLLKRCILAVGLKSKSAKSTKIYEIQ